MPISTTLIRKLSDLDPALREVILLLLEEVERQRGQLAQQVTQKEFLELKEVVAGLARTMAELAEAQKRTEERLTRLEVTVAELAEAQKRTEKRLNELIEAQKHTEERLTRLEATVAELAEAQKRTEESLNQLATAHQVTRERLEGISNAVGYTLEDRALRSLPQRLLQEGVEVQEPLVRKYIRLRNKERQVNIYGLGKRNGQEVLIMGEAKVRPSRKEVERFLRLAHRLAEEEGRELFLVFVAYDFPPAMEAYLRDRGILPVWSYELSL
ncbi:MAG TPA: chordopoxvirus fusion protein [Anaerolineae bacterium]|nr:chordopoxvirus fusion protein [Anaerolineae bacterium]